jgi:hypothetical protein
MRKKGKEIQLICTADYSEKNKKEANCQNAEKYLF